MKKLVLMAALILGCQITHAQVVVNPDGSHSVVHGSVIINADGTHSTIHGSTVINPDGTHSILVGSTIVNPGGKTSQILDNTPDDSLFSSRTKSAAASNKALKKDKFDQRQSTGTAERVQSTKSGVRNENAKRKERKQERENRRKQRTYIRSL